MESKFEDDGQQSFLTGREKDYSEVRKGHEQWVPAFTVPLVCPLYAQMVRNLTRIWGVVRR